MRDDQGTLHGAPQEGDSRARTGPRHAAPRKSLLTKLHIPAGKAIALAAMPTAVFVGMGLTPKLAQADELPSNPFAPGPCVTRSDEPDPQKSPSASESAKPDPTPTAEPSASASPSAGATKAPQSSSGSGGTSDKATDSPSPSPTPTESKNPFDPLGIGDALGGLLGTKSSDSPSPTSSATPDAKPSSSTASSAQPTADKTAGDAQATTKDAIQKAADKVGAKVAAVKDTAKSATKSATSKSSQTTAAADGKEPFPCPTADPKALENAKLEQGIPLLPDKPWQLESSRLTLRGLDFKGIVEVRTFSGKVKKVLKFTAKETDIKDLHQLVDGPQGTVGHVQAREGSTSTIRNGTVTMYTEELKGNLFGLIPITFSPETPPPLNVPVAFFTDVHVVQAGQFGGTLTVPGMHVFNTAD